MVIDYTAKSEPIQLPVTSLEGYEPAENSYAKNHAMDALERELENQGIVLYEDGSPELIELADAVVEALLAAGVAIPENITNPHAISS